MGRAVAGFEDRVGAERHNRQTGGFAGQLTLGAGSTLVGDVGLVALKCLLEQGLETLLTSQARDHNLVDSAIADLRETILAPIGVRVRRIPPLESMREFLNSETAAGLTCVVWSGSHGVRASVEAFSAMAVARPTVGICFDEAVLSARGISVVEPHPTARGVRGAVDEAVRISIAEGRPAVVLLRGRALTMRAAMPCRDNSRTPGRGVQEGADQTSQFEAAPPPAEQPVSDAIVLCGDAVAAAARAAVAELVRAVETHAPRQVMRCAVVSVRCLTDVSEDVRAQLRDARTLLIVDDLPEPLGPQIADGPPDIPTHRVRVSYTATTTSEIQDVVEDWAMEAGLVADSAGRVLLERRRERQRRLRPAREFLTSVPARHARWNPALPACVSAAMSILQAEVGVPMQPDPAYPTFRTDAGQMLTVVSDEDYLLHGDDVVAPVGRAGVVVVAAHSGSAPHVVARAGDRARVAPGSRPLQLAQTILAMLESGAGPAVLVVISDAFSATDGSTALLDPEPSAADAAAIAVLPVGMVHLRTAADRALPAVSDPVAAQGLVRDLSEVIGSACDVRGLGSPSRTHRATGSVRRKLVRIIGRTEL